MDYSVFIAGNLAPIFGLIILTLMLRYNTSLEPHVRRAFAVLSGMALLELVVYNLELWTAAWPEPSTLRVLLSAIGYSIRPAIVYLIIYINDRNGRRWERRLLAIPCVVGVLIAFSAFFSDAAYYYDSANQFHRGPLGYFSLVIIAFNLLLLVPLAVRNQRAQSREAHDRLEFAVLAICILYICAAMAFEALFNIRSIGRSATVFSAIFYFMYFQTKQYNDSVRAISSHAHEELSLDRLTGVYNKRGFAERVSGELAAHSGGQALLFMDVDRFKDINDSYGHLAGDAVLKGIATALKVFFRSDDVIGRFGGDEFYVFINDISEGSLDQRLSELVQAIGQERFGPDRNIPVTLSIGAICFTGERDADLTELLDIADKALYEVKDREGNGYSVKIYRKMS